MDPDLDDSSQTRSTASTSGKKTRSKQGCLVCRARRVKCDYGKPECERCVKYGSECVYPQKKRFDPLTISSALASRHKKPAPSSPKPLLSPDEFRQLHPSISNDRTDPTHPKPNAEPPIQPNNTRPASATSDAIPLVLEELNIGSELGLPPLFSIDELMTFFRQTQMGAYYRQTGAQELPDFLRPVFPDEDDLRCFHHCVTYSFSICVTREDFNPWVQHISPLFLFPDGESPICAEAVKLGMLSIGAAHLSYLEHRDHTITSDGSHWRTLSDRYRLQTVRLMRQAIKVQGEFTSDSFIAAAMMTLYADVLSARVEWREIHRMLRQSILRRGGLSIMLFGPDKQNSAIPSSLKKYLAEQVAFLEIVASHVCRDVPLLMLGDLGWFDRLGELAVEDDMAESIEATFGVHRSTFHLTTSTAIYLGRAARDRTNEYYLLTPSSACTLMTRPQLPPSTIEFGQKCLSSLTSWKTYVLPQLDLDARTYAGSMAYWHACMILLLRDLEGRERGDEVVQKSAGEVVGLAQGAGDKVEFMMWPLMIASSVLLTPETRTGARDLLKTFQYQCCYEAEGTLSVVEEVWRRVDEGRDEEACGVAEVMLEMGRPILLG